MGESSSSGRGIASKGMKKIHEDDSSGTDSGLSSKQKITGDEQRCAFLNVYNEIKRRSANHYMLVI